MATFRSQFPDLTAVKRRLDERWTSELRQHFISLEPAREEIWRFQKRSITSFILLLVFGVPFYFGLIENALTGGVFLLMLVPTIIYFGFSVYELIKARHAFSLAFNRFLYPKLFSVFDLSISYHSGIDQSNNYGTAASRSGESDDPDHNVVIDDLKRSELLTDRVEHDLVDDIVKTTFHNLPLMVSEISSTRTEGSGKNRRTVTVFKGIFVTYQLPSALSGVTFVSTEGDESGYGHRDFWSRVMGKSAVEETVLEWNEFERDLHVAATDGTEARYILTPDLMQDLHQWWREHKRNIRLVFRGNQLAILFPDKKIEMADATTSLEERKLKEYAMTILTPLWYILLLLDEVNDRFKH